MTCLDLTALERSAAIKDQRLAVVDLMEATLDRIEAVNEALNAIVSLRDRDDLMGEACAVQDAPRKGWLHGIPIAIKDLAHARGLPTSMGSPLFAGQVANYDEPMVARLRDAGAIVIGKTNVPEFGLGSHTFNPVHGTTVNPYDHGRTAGGSSGGAAVALATGMLSVADGSDMMGSLRNPAGWNNVYGLRPTWGTVPSDPVGDVFMHQLATLGPMARTPADLAALLDTMTGPLAGQPLSVAAQATLPMLSQPAGTLRIGWLGDWGGALPFEEGILPLSEAALRQIGGLGHQISDVAAPFDAARMWNSWTDLRSFSIASGLYPLFADAETRDRLKTSAQWEIARGMTLTGTELNAASLARSDWYHCCMDLFREIDVLVLPSAQCWPFEVGMEHVKEIAGVHMDTYHRWMQVVIPASLVGLPVVNIPIGFGDNGLPAGLQLIGPRGAEGRLLQLAQQWHDLTDWPNARRPVI